MKFIATDKLFDYLAGTMNGTTVNVPVNLALQELELSPASRGHPDSRGVDALSG
jgi:hypothetical protein